MKFNCIYTLNEIMSNKVFGKDWRGFGEDANILLSKYIVIRLDGLAGWCVNVTGLYSLNCITLLL